MRKLFVSSILALVALAASAAPAYTAGNVQVTDLAVSPSGESVVLVGADGTKHLVRFDSDGRPVESFGDDGAIAVTGEINDIAIGDDGKVFVIEVNRDESPWHGYGPPHPLFRYSANGERDPGFGFQGQTLSPTLGPLAVQPDGKVLVTGNGETRFRGFQLDTGAKLSRFSVDGKLDPGFGDGGTVHRPETSYFYSPKIDPSGRIAVISNYEFFRFDSSGTPDPALNGVPLEQSELTAFAIDGEKVLLAGSTQFMPPVRLRRLNEDGTPDDSFGTGDGTASPALGGDFGVSDVRVLPDGRIQLISRSGAAQARLSPSGELDTTFGTDGRISLQPAPGIFASASAFHRGDGTLMAGGDGPELVVARIDSDGMLDAGFGVDGRSRWSLPAVVVPPARYCFGKIGGHRADGSFATDGTKRADVLAGGDGKDRLRGFRGADSICGKASGDVITPGPGRDRVRGGAGADRILARDGRRDAIDCGSGRDLVMIDRRDRLVNCERVRFIK